ncbi:MAG: hypothetical protein ACKVQJ_14610 [Pyrinomonadaceae bacterium]
MKHFQLAILLLVALTLFVGSADAQRKRRKIVKKPVVAKTVIPPLDVRAAREKVDNQLSNVNDFVNKLGTIAEGLEIADADAKANRLKPATAAKIEAKKSEIVGAIQNFKLGLGNLESDFRTKAALQKYLENIKGITDLAAEAEDFAIAGKFVAAKEPLRSIAQKLTDTLAVMPASPPL